MSVSAGCGLRVRRARRGGVGSRRRRVRRGWRLTRSARRIAGALRELGHEVHFTSVAMFMRLLGYSLQANVKTREGASHPDRDAQFAHINQTAAAAVAAGWPVISVDTKKKE